MIPRGLQPPHQQPRSWELCSEQAAVAEHAGKGRGSRSALPEICWVWAGRQHCLFLSYSPHKSPALPKVCGCFHRMPGAVGYQVCRDTAAFLG